MEIEGDKHARRIYFAMQTIWPLEDCSAIVKKIKQTLKNK